MIAGIGVDVVDLARFERAVARTPKLRERLFAESERGLPLQSPGRAIRRQEALIKALGESTGVQWHDMEVVSDEHGKPLLPVSGAVAALAEARAIARLHLSMSHDAGVAVAMVVAEGRRMTAQREAVIDLDAVRGNIATLRDIVAPAAVMAVVKADAYGHGMVPVARAAVEGGAAWLGVADIDEALTLRAAGIASPILAWLHGWDADFAAAIAADVELGISSLAQLERAAGATVHIKVDTGLSRNGVSESDAPAVFARAAELERAGRVRVRGVFSHLSNTSPDEDARQLERFEARVSEARAAGLDPEVRHLAATEAALREPGMRFELVRIGIGMYGLPPADGVDVAALGLRR